MSLQIAILYGSVREARQGIKAARFVDAQLCERGHATCLIDAKACRLPLLDRMYKEYPKGEAPEVMEKLAAIYRAVDAFVVVTRRVQPRHPARAQEPARPLPRGVLLAPLGDRLLLGGCFRRGAGGDAAADDPGRARDGEHPFPVPGAQGAGRV